MMLGFQIVPAPDRAIADPHSERLGLVRGLNVEVKEEQFRCAECDMMQPRGSLVVWVPYGVRRSDPEWAVEETCRATTYNRSGSGWCVPCAPKKATTKAVESAPEIKRGFWARLFAQ